MKPCSKDAINRYFNRVVDNVMNPDQSRALNNTNYNSVPSVISVSIKGRDKIWPGSWK